MDTTTLSTKLMYDEFPYPSRALGTVAFKELRNLLHIFTLETGFDFAGKQILDAGTGTGHRLAMAAESLPNARFTAVDLSGNALAIARSHPSLQRARFEQANLAEDLAHLGTFDVILRMGVLHHLASPLQGLKNLVGRLNDRGIIFLYVYGARGAAERMRRKESVRTLLGSDGALAKAYNSSRI
jgi:2-polyprenyl-3-methyl-5-hydroxy-6-metoxy-1,4-benzoquinol methylase